MVDKEVPREEIAGPKQRSEMGTIWKIHRHEEVLKIAHSRVGVAC